jgi:hypothetical protein
MKTYQSYRQLSLLLMSATFCIAAFAEESAVVQPAARPLMIGGTQHSSESAYTYLGLIRPIWGGELGKGWFHSVIGSWLAYEYDINIGNQPDTLKAKAPGIDTGLGYAWTGKDYNLSLSMALGYRHYNLSPNVPGEKPEGSTFNLTPQVQAGYNLTDSVDVALLSNYSFGQQSNFNRLRLGFKPINNWHMGLEALYQEGRNYRIKQQGLFATTYLNNGLSLELSGGNLESKDGSSTGYVGIAFSKLF